MAKGFLRKISAWALALIVCCAPALFAQGFPGNVPAVDPGHPRGTLQGVYSLIGTRTCVQTGFGQFTPEPELRLLAPATTRTSQFSGGLRLNGDGTGKAEFRQLQINHQVVSAGGQPVSIALSFCDVFYQPLADGTVELTTANCDNPIVSGAGAGGSATSSEAALSVTMTMDGSVLLLSDTEPVVEDVFVTIGGATFPSSRICGRSYTAVRLSPSPGN